MTDEVMLGHYENKMKKSPFLQQVNQDNLAEYVETKVIEELPLSEARPETK
ncbi:hypothetical protein GF345_02720, partial [Candidatus Woesearchaeota archaeon]|nr:hypothetical protein [Candidatus Woesearchaeota archaeon]